MHVLSFRLLKKRSFNFLCVLDVVFIVVVVLFFFFFFTAYVSSSEGSPFSKGKFFVLFFSGEPAATEMRNLLY